VASLAIAVLLMGTAVPREEQPKGSPRGREGGSCEGKDGCPARSEKVRRIRVLQDGARPRFSPGGDRVVYDAKGADGFYDVYLADAFGEKLRGLTDGRKGIGQRNNGNAVFSPDGEYVVFISEEERHLGDQFPWMADPGVGLFSNIWATNLSGTRFWKLTHIPIKIRLVDKTPAIGTVNPHFSPDGRRLYWTERYAAGGHHNWGRWRIKSARFVVGRGGPRLEGETVVFEPSRGNYVTSMGFLDRDHLLVAGNLDGQHEFAMDQYVLDLRTGTARPIQTTPFWEEGACIGPRGEQFVFMSNETSRYPLNFEDANWAAQPTEREYWLIDRSGRNKERLTYFNDSSAPEYLGTRVIVAACSISGDGAYLAGTLGVDHGNERKAQLELKLVMIEFKSPLR